MHFAAHPADTLPTLEPAGALVVFAFDPPLDGAAARIADVKLAGAVGALASAGDFAGKPKELAVLYPGSTGLAPRIVLAGLGARGKATLEGLRRAAGEATKRAQGLRVAHVAIWAHDELLALAGGDPERLARELLEAADLAAYVDRTFKTKRDDEGRPGAEDVARISVHGSTAHRPALERAAKAATATSRAIRTARDLGNLPPNECFPRLLADRAAAMARDVGLGCRVLDEIELERLGMGALLGVGRGSVEPPRLIVLEHEGGRAGERPLVLVGKGVTFDTGGISIKGSDKLEEMKFDKCGACAVIGALEASARLGLGRRVIGLVPAAENMPDGNAQRPGDIRRALDGQTIEIVNTDAEGRLLLADALAYACREYAPEAIVDLATLTGAVVVALGAVHAGLFANDDTLAAELARAGERTGERLWRLPLDPDYDELLKSPYADMKNIGGRWGGAISASMFLQRFVKSPVPWAHLDIAGTAWTTEPRPYYAPGATGFGVRLLVDWITARIRA